MFAVWFTISSSVLLYFCAFQPSTALADVRSGDGSGKWVAKGGPLVEYETPEGLKMRLSQDSQLVQSDNAQSPTTERPVRPKRRPAPARRSSPFAKAHQLVEEDSPRRPQRGGSQGAQESAKPRRQKSPKKKGVTWGPDQVVEFNANDPPAAVRPGQSVRLKPQPKPSIESRPSLSFSTDAVRPARTAPPPQPPAYDYPPPDTYSYGSVWRSKKPQTSTFGSDRNWGQSEPTFPSSDSPSTGYKPLSSPYGGLTWPPPPPSPPVASTGDGYVTYDVTPPSPVAGLSLGEYNGVTARFLAQRPKLGPIVGYAPSDYAAAYRFAEDYARQKG